MDRAQTRTKVAQLGPVPPPHGGVSTNMLAIHNMLRSEGFEPVLIDITNRDKGSETPDVLKPRSAIGLIRLLWHLECDIVHYHIGGKFSMKLALLMLFCGWLPGKKSVVTFHSGGFARSSGATARRFSVLGLAFRSVDLLIGVNSQMLDMFRTFGVPEDRIRLILPFDLKQPERSLPLPVDLSKFIDKADPFIIAVGGLEPEYLNAFLIDAMPAISGRYPNCRLLIAGSGTLESELRQKVDRMGLAGRVLLGGNIEHDILLDLIERADVLLRLTEYDGDAISVREALYLGTPVVATDNGMRPEKVTLVPNVPEEDDLLAALSTALAGATSANTFSYSDERNIEKVLEVYQELVAK